MLELTETSDPVNKTQLLQDLRVIAGLSSRAIMELDFTLFDILLNHIDVDQDLEPLPEALIQLTHVDYEHQTDIATLLNTVISSNKSLHTYHHPAVKSILLVVYALYIGILTVWLFSIHFHLNNVSSQLLHNITNTAENVLHPISSHFVLEFDKLIPSRPLLLKIDRLENVILFASFATPIYFAVLVFRNATGVCVLLNMIICGIATQLSRKLDLQVRPAIVTSINLYLRNIQEAFLMNQREPSVVQTIHKSMNTYIHKLVTEYGQAAHTSIQRPRCSQYCSPNESLQTTSGTRLRKKMYAEAYDAWRCIYLSMYILPVILVCIVCAVIILLLYRATQFSQQIFTSQSISSALLHPLEAFKNEGLICVTLVAGLNVFTFFYLLVLYSSSFLLWMLESQRVFHSVAYKEIALINSKVI